MKINYIREFLEFFDFFNGDYVIRFGQARVIHGVSETSEDYDIYIPSKLFDELFVKDVDHFLNKMFVQEVHSQGGFPKTYKVVYLYEDHTFEIFADADFENIDRILYGNLYYVSKDQLFIDYDRLKRKKDWLWTLKS